MKERVKKSFICRNCNSHYETNGMSSKFCCDECRKEFKVKDGKEISKDYVICQICSRATANVTGVHLRNHTDWTPERYHKEFPNCQTIAKTTLKKITAGSKKSGAMMREIEHRERLSRMFKGENNPMHKTKTSEEKRKSSSPFSPSFYLKKFPNISIEEAESMAKNKLSENVVISWVKEEYWMEKGFTQDEAKKIISEKQSTFSLEKCITKYGEIEGTEVWKKRQEKWAKNYKKNNYSKNSQKLFVSLYNVISVKYSGIYFATLNENKEIVDNGKNHEYRLSLIDRVIMPDFYVEETKKIIEFDGVYWHDYKRRNKRENEKREIEKDISIIDSGYQILRISELEWEKYPLETIKKCLDYLIEDEKKT
jgi:very-short-patch-repair endonuclease